VPASILVRQVPAVREARVEAQALEAARAEPAVRMERATPVKRTRVAREAASELVAPTVEAKTMRATSKVAAPAASSRRGAVHRTARSWDWRWVASLRRAGAARRSIVSRTNEEQP